MITPILLSLIPQFTAQEAVDLREIYNTIQEAQEKLQEAEELLLDYILDASPDPDPLPEPDPDPDPPSGSLEEYLASMPFDVPTFPSYTIPTQEDCEWIIENNVARSTRGLQDIAVTPGDPTYLIGPAYRASIAAGHELPIDFGVRDNAGTAVFGDGWSSPGSWNKRSVFVEDFRDMRCRLVGLTPQAEIIVSWGKRWGYVEELGLYNIGLRGPNDSFIIRANEGIGDLTLDGCWFLTAENHPDIHTSGMHTDDWRTLIIRNHKYVGTLFDEHPFYLKSSEGATWIVQNDLRGGNRTGFQIRPGADDPGNDRPVGPIVIALNVTDKAGFDHEVFNGGSFLTVWSNPEGNTYVLGNRITDARYGCLSINAQGWYNGKQVDWLNDKGFPIRNVWVWDNVFTNPRAQRAAASVTAVERLHFGPNQFTKLFLNNEWGMKKHGIGNGEVILYDPEILHESVWTYDTKVRPLEESELQPLLVN